MTSKSTHYDYLVKMLLIGDSGVGKSSLLLQYTEDTFTDDFISTIGIDFRIKTININDKKIKLQIWDTAGQERFRTITSAYYRGAMGIFIVYDVADLKTFQNIKYWVKNVKENALNDVSLMLIGNKCDIKDREVSFEMGKALADELNIKFIETSAKTNVNIDEMHNEMVDDVLKYIDKTYKNTISEKNIKLDKNNTNNTNTHNKSKSCCN